MRYCDKYEACPRGLVHSVRKLGDPLLAEIMRVMVSKTAEIYNRGRPKKERVSYITVKKTPDNFYEGTRP